MMLKFAIKDFLDEREFRQVSPKTLVNYQVLLKDFHFYCVDHETINIEDITPTTVKSYLLFCQREKHNAPASINTKLTAIKTLFNYLEEIDVITSKQNPTKKIGHIKAEVKITTFSDAQIKEMLTYYRRIRTRDKTYFAYRDYMIITFLVSSGVRLVSAQ